MVRSGEEWRGVERSGEVVRSGEGSVINDCTRYAYLVAIND